ncbi:tannase/feruloyl esterase family alpha/beta hydrolase [Neorhizobium vignae]|uniref:tannase/feruloyl esterase family alpha/beta hydrolase n=1 Tax=Neorhizobium vignae TaxID=690585 RepID=UPI00055E4D3D|nr:tannase/feruloyl esterase family alpha/beta hydrolase [Neorhizobium vignae]
MQPLVLKCTMLALIGAGAMIGVPASAQDWPNGKCTALRDTVFDAGYVTSARVIDTTGAVPAYCEVRAVALPAISIEVRLPITDWNGRFYQVGCGGFCGNLGGRSGFVNAMGPGLQRGYATATTDSGHYGLASVDADWADGNVNAERDWGWRSIGETNRVAQVMIQAFYGMPSDQAIFQGCSTGGRMANMAALRYPKMFQGIISGAPALNETGLAGPGLAWQVKANTGPDGKQILKADKVDLIGAEVMRQCDGVDGSEDKIIADPRQCSVDLSKITCNAGAATKACITAEERQVVEKWRSSPVDSSGRTLFVGGIPEGSEPFWRTWLTGNEAGAPGLNPLFAQSFGSYMAYPQDPGPAYKATEFDFDKDPPRMAAAAKMYNADDPDISAFRAAGGKMIVWHGWADAIVSPYTTIAWHEAAEKAAGGADVLAKNVRLFMIPGLDHCGIAPGPGGLSQANLDPLGALESWMQKGEAPQSLMVRN